MPSAVRPPAAEHVAAALLRRDGRVLLGHRTAQRRWTPSCWDVVGGHVEAGEAPADALVRELAEELGVHLDPPGAPAALSRSWPDWRLDVWIVDRWEGDVVNAAPHEHDDLAWVGSDTARAWARADLLAGPWVADAVRLALGS